MPTNLSNYNTLNLNYFYSNTAVVNGSPYYQRVLNTYRSNLIVYWPLWDTNGSIAIDVASGRCNGAYTAVTLGQFGVGDGRTTAQFNGATSYVNAYSTGLAGAFNGADGTLSAWARVVNVGVWTDGAARFIANIAAHITDNRVVIAKVNPNTMRFRYTAGGTAILYDTPYAGTGWTHYAITWSKVANAVHCYINGIDLSGALPGLGVWAGVLNATMTYVGATDSVPTNVWSGQLAHVALWNTALPVSSIMNLARVN
jgi:hypothetical protein